MRRGSIRGKGSPRGVCPDWGDGSALRALDMKAFFDKDRLPESIAALFPTARITLPVPGGGNRQLRECDAVLMVLDSVRVFKQFAYRLHPLPVDYDTLRTARTCYLAFYYAQNWQIDPAPHFMTNHFIQFAERDHGAFFALGERGAQAPRRQARCALHAWPRPLWPRRAERNAAATRPAEYPPRARSSSWATAAPRIVPTLCALPTSRRSASRSLLLDLVTDEFMNCKVWCNTTRASFPHCVRVLRRKCVCPTHFHASAGPCRAAPRCQFRKSLPHFEIPPPPPLLGIRRPSPLAERCAHSSATLGIRNLGPTRTSVYKATLVHRTAGFRRHGGNRADAAARRIAPHRLHLDAAPRLPNSVRLPASPRWHTTIACGVR